MTHPILERARGGTPLIDGTTATFVWHGVRGLSAPQLIGDFTGWQYGTPLELSPTAPEVWVHALTLPADAYVEYSFLQDGQRVPDPLNRRTVADGLGHVNHSFYMPGAKPTPLIQKQPKTARGTVSHHPIGPSFLLSGGRRAVDLYQPPVSDPSPLLVVLDGQDYRPRGRIVQIVDNLIAQGRIRPLAMAMVHHGVAARGVEYGCSDVHLGALLELVLPLARKHLHLLDLQAHPGAYGIVGASMGGLMALYAGLRAPGTFGHVLSQSGAFDFGGSEGLIWHLVRHSPVPPLRIWMDVGRFEWLLEPNRSMQALLIEKGYDVTYREFSGGHNYASWRDDLWRGLELLFGPPTAPAAEPDISP